MFALYGVLVLACLVVAVGYVGGQVSVLGDHIRAAPPAACGSVPGPNCLTNYPGTAVAATSPSPGETDVVLHQPPLVAYVPVRPADAARLHYPSAVTFSAGGGWVTHITSGPVSFATLDGPPTAIAVPVSRIIGVGWVCVFLICMAASYLIIGYDIKIWRVHPRRWVRYLNVARLLTSIGGLGTFVGFVLASSTGLAVAAVGLLGIAVASHLVRRHGLPPSAPQQPVEMRHQRAGGDATLAGMWLAVAFPLPIGIVVGLRQYADHGDVGAGIVAPIVGAALAAVLVLLMRRQITRSPQAPGGSVTPGLDVIEP